MRPIAATVLRQLARHRDLPPGLVHLNQRFAEFRHLFVGRVDLAAERADRRLAGLDAFLSALRLLRRILGVDTPGCIRARDAEPLKLAIDAGDLLVELIGFGGRLGVAFDAGDHCRVAFRHQQGAAVLRIGDFVVDIFHGVFPVLHERQQRCDRVRHRCGGRRPSKAVDQ